MAIYRQIQISFWYDIFVLELTPEEKYFYCYIMTNPSSTQCGIFEFSIMKAALETGYNTETINKLIKRFINYGKILYSEETRELMIINWMKYNFINSRNTILCMNKEIKKVKNKELVKKLYDICISLEHDVTSIFNGINSCFQGASKDLGEEETKTETYIQEETLNREKTESENLKDNSHKDRKNCCEEAVNKILLEFNKNMRKATLGDIEKLKNFTKDFDSEIIIKAIYEGAERKAAHPAYIWTILNNWGQLGLFTVDKFSEYKQRTKKNRDEGIEKCNADAYKYME